jgi:hypothetical protein
MPSSEHRVENATDLPLHGLPIVKPAGGLTLLRGIRVVDLTTSIAGPYASMLLGDFGAEIIKVERPEGDDARGWGPPFLDGESLWFAAVNRNKKSVVLDLNDDEDRARLRRLVATADVFITNQPPSVQKKLGLDHETIKAIREDIVFTSITGFGLDGARADLTCYDLIAEGYSGIMDLTGEAGGAAQKIGAPAADMLAGQDAAMATMAALPVVPARLLSRLGRGPDPFRRHRQRHRHLSGVRDRRPAADARPRQRRDLAAVLGRGGRPGLRGAAGILQQRAAPPASRGHRRADSGNPEDRPA